MAKNKKKNEEATTAKPLAGLVQSVVISLSDIVPNKGQIPGVPKNPRQMKDDVKFRKLKASIQDDPEMLALREVLIYQYNGLNVIIGGNMRYRALKELGYTETIAKIIPPETSPEKLRAIVIKDNVAFGDWNMDDLANEWEIDELDHWGVDLPDIDTGKAENEAEEDDYDVAGNLPSKPKARYGDVYRLGNHRLICADSTKPEVLDILIGDGKVDLLLTDPPYNVDYSSKNEALNAADKGNRVQKDIANDKMADGAFLDFLTAAFENANRYLKKGGAFYIWHAGTEGLNFKLAVKSVGWELKQILIWAKNNMILGRQDYQWKHEPCLYGWKPGASHFFINRRDLLTLTEDEAPDIDSMTKDELKALLRSLLNEDKTPTTVIHEDKPLRSADHPTMKPIKLMGRAIKNSTRPGEVVLDLFGGSGSTLMAAEQLARSCYTVELDPAYIDVIIKRWEEYTGDNAELLGNFAPDADEPERE